ncbi:PAAR domain-containing protein [Zoogloea sp. LCSB751]|uniref:PAAR domain-containing protein n=1 Tax=Zoogloea sp. LCSB751 TaxID=1965277 RepID=UPI0009A4A4DD|nr:PAAR domain-containing protein [Zoogloea sp. LCSB751]
MAKRAIIREGDPTSHGGTVLEAFPTFSIYGKNAVGVGHRGYCPLCKTTFTIVSGARNYTFMDKNVAVEGMHTSCGAVLIATQGQATLDDALGANPILANAPSSRTLPLSRNNETAAFDEQIRFFTADRNVLANTRYKLTLEDGRTVEGTTDSTGRTARITTDTPTTITCAEFYPDTVYGCACQVEHMCEAEGRGPAPALTTDIKDIKTNPQAIGSSTVDHTLPKATDTRNMTAGEIAMAQTVFKSSLDYSAVKIHRGGLFGQPSRSGNAMTPRGEIHFPDKDYKEDFSIEIRENKIWFIHEMTHVWQYQLGYNVVFGGMTIGLKGGYSDDGKRGLPSPAYRYDLTGEDKGKTMSQFNMEQQGELVSHYFGVTQLGMNKNINALEAVLADFLKNPADPSLLPITTKIEP